MASDLAALSLVELEALVVEDGLPLPPSSYDKSDLIKMLNPPLLLATIGNSPRQPPKKTPTEAPALKVGSMLGSYKVGKLLGQGAFAKVHLAQDLETGREVAIKCLDKLWLTRGQTKLGRKSVLDNARREIEINQRLAHQNVVKLIECIETEEGLYMVLERVLGGELFDHILRRKGLREDEARRLFQQLVAGVDHCHKHHVTHRDLKPENILLDGNLQTLKILDFGLANLMTDREQLNSGVGTLDYACPEILSGKLYNGCDADIWSCGVTLFAMVAYATPFGGASDHETRKLILRGSYHRHLLKDKSIELQDLLSRMFQVNPRDRLTIAQIKQHPWFLNAPVPSLEGSSDTTISSGHVTANEQEALSAVHALGVAMLRAGFRIFTFSTFTTSHTPNSHALGLLALYGSGV